jgi:hypothetical protein
MSGVNIMNLKTGLCISIFLITTDKRENVYCACNGRTISFLNDPQQETPLPETVMALIILF